MIPVTGISLSVFPITGGVELTITGVFTVGIPYTVYIGPSGDSTDEPCYSGVSGDGYECYSEDGVTLECVTPPLDRGSVEVSVYGGGDSGVWAHPYGYYYSSPVAIEDTFVDILFDFRRQWARWYDTGPRDLSLEPRQDT